MTTIVLADNVMAADSQVSSSYIQHGFNKIFETEIGVYAFAGDPYNIEIFVKALDYLYTEEGDIDEEGEFFSFKPDGLIVESKHLDEDPSACIFFIKETGETGYAKIDSNGYVRRMFAEQPLVYGSGQDFAIAALSMGKTAEEAVKLAIELDMYSGGSVSTVECVKDTPKEE